MKIDWDPLALDDLDRLHDYLLEFSETAADDAIMTILDASDKLLKHPALGRPYKDKSQYRELVIPFGQRAYILRYHPLNDTIIILRIWHGLEER
ncbi:type II toxin-antitoxin system RelE/ParE family toxin [Hellea sp.]|nr:type II toxin-antitoxin system RelE/ParE family toxin [Hellea sp.]